MGNEKKSKKNKTETEMVNKTENYEKKLNIWRKYGKKHHNNGRS